MFRAAGWICAALLTPAAAPGAAQDANITAPVPELERMLAEDPFVVVAAEISRPKARGDITLRADLSFAGREPLRVKLRKSAPGAETFNNVPRYDLAAYELQKLFLDPAEYVVPPTALRMLPGEELRAYARDVERTFGGSDDVLAVVQYWLHDVKVVEDVLDPARFDRDPVYARHVGQLNLLTYLIEHRDSNVGNFLLGKAESGARVFAVDNGISFAAESGDRGELWKEMRVRRLPADAVARLRALDLHSLETSLAVVAQWELRDGHFVRVPPGPALKSPRGVRRDGDMLQMGLTPAETRQVDRRRLDLLKRIDRGEITVF